MKIKQIRNGYSNAALKIPNNWNLKAHPLPNAMAVALQENEQVAARYYAEF